MTDTATATIAPNMGARANADYAWRAAQEHRSTVRRILERGVRKHAQVAAELNRLGIPSSNGRPWGVASVGRLLSRLGKGRVVIGEQHAEAVREDVIELWSMGVRVPLQMAIGLERRAVPCPDGDCWTKGKVGRVLTLLGDDWKADYGPIRLRRGDTVPEVRFVIAMDETAELDTAPEPEAIEVPGTVQETGAAEPLELEPFDLAPRRRAVRL
ncbi:hypothetical protein [Methylobacterium sp. AMS5]|uniref:hypothetical protein n=1 Tax=Methylobacterium sp. AMS5 TaxID=925818 RepID=UPI00074F9DE4|nr:hypothetical protein [Methylobacterium sp. AMS5]AMB46892.1 hypothetical protein Y590_18300 [Methylobacterium sp. AMS5]